MINRMTGVWRDATLSSSETTIALEKQRHRLFLEVPITKRGGATSCGVVICITMFEHVWDGSTE